MPGSGYCHTLSVASIQIMQFNAKSFAIAAVIYGIIIGAGSQYILHAVDAATAKQCKQHDWPAHADELHREWCVTNGYKI